MSSSSYPPNQGAFSAEQGRYPAHSEFAVPDFRSSHLEVGQGSQLLQQQQQLRRRPSLLSEFHPGSDRPQERRSGYESQFHTGPSQADLDALDSKRPRLDQVSDSHYQREPVFGGKHEGPPSPMSSQACGEDQNASPSKLSKEELIQSMDRVDREIAKQQLEEEAAKPPEPEKPVSPPPVEQKHRSIVQIIYDENREFAVPDFRTSHLEVGQGSQLLQQQQQLRRRPSLLSEPQERRSGYESQFHTGPSQADLTQLDSKRHAWTRFGLSLPAEQKICQRYDQLMEAWEKKVDRIENNPRRKAKESKTREYYEKHWPKRTAFATIAGLSKSRDHRRAVRTGEQRETNAPAVRHSSHDVRCRAETGEVHQHERADGGSHESLQGPAVHERLDGSREGDLQRKNFGLIASYLERKNVPDCVLYYYLTKKNENYKALVRRNYGKRRGRNQVSCIQSF
ncbi:hypothetical protein E2320_018055 [Naja naja]|nr:hypothetical protein E2320_018055 [Naja naja]